MTTALTRNLSRTSRTSNTGHRLTGRPLPGTPWFPGMKGLLISAALLALIGCSNPKKIEPDKLSTIESAKQVDVLWSANLGDGSERSVVQFAPYVSDSSVFGVNAEGKVYAFDRTSGAKIWEIDLNTELTAGISGDDRYLYATVLIRQMEHLHGQRKFPLKSFQRPLPVQTMSLCAALMAVFMLWRNLLASAAGCILTACQR